MEITTISEKDDTYYDKIYSERESYFAHYSESQYFKLWQKVISLIADKPIKIVEIGCGTGQFARMIADKFKDVIYCGIDFSQVAINQAKKNIPEFEQYVKCESVYEYEIPHCSLVIALEVLEHLDDLRVLSEIKSGTEIIFTVPDFADPAHLRYFSNAEEIKNRYNKHIEFTFAERHERWFVCAGKIK